MQDASTRWGEACGHCGGVGVGVLNPVNYSAYGTPDAAIGSPFAFTGELYNPTTDMLYLRARHYRPSLGIFTSRDPFEGMAGRPMSLNGYSWVEGNVVNWNDPSGAIPSLGTIQNRTHTYSCNCGWIDLPHVYLGLLVGIRIKQALEMPINYQMYNAVERVRIVNTSHNVGNGMISIPNLIASYFVVNDDSLGEQSRRQAIGLGMFKNDLEGYETFQDVINLTGESGFAEEDLPSYLIGYWLATHHLNNAEVDRLVELGSENSKQDTRLNTELMQLCHLVDSAVSTTTESQYIYEEYTRYGSFDINWRQWFAKPAPSGVFSGCNNRLCPTHTWPHELNLVSEERGYHSSLNFSEMSGWIDVRENFFHDLFPYRHLIPIDNSEYLRLLPR
ncbi:MAG: RHS repeat-associated core domain-containing protein [Chloroflexota bacterium]|nr:RHS repeat-associated core domain-containing protein [Chloroflexota bacterium]